MPGDTSTCSFSEGYVRQAVYACKTCDLSLTGQRGGFCFACSISCHSGKYLEQQRVEEADRARRAHLPSLLALLRFCLLAADHDLIELFPKRHFKCDCPTFTFPTHACSLQTPPSSASKLVSSRAPFSLVVSKLTHLTFCLFQPPNTQNHYDHNFDGIFCICRAPYDAQEEAESMIQVRSLVSLPVPLLCSSLPGAVRCLSTARSASSAKTGSTNPTSISSLHLIPPPQLPLPFLPTRLPLPQPPRTSRQVLPQFSPKMTTSTSSATLASLLIQFSSTTSERPTSCPSSDPPPPPQTRWPGKCWDGLSRKRQR